MTQPTKSDFVTGIGPLQAISLVVGSMIGSGIFIVSADIGRQMDGWGPGGLMLVWVITGLMTLAGALSYAELAGMMPKAGGQYVFLRERGSPPGPDSSTAGPSSTSSRPVPSPPSRWLLPATSASSFPASPTTSS